MIVHDSARSNARDSSNYHQLSSTIMTVWTGLYDTGLWEVWRKGLQADTASVFYWLAGLLYWIVINLIANLLQIFIASIWEQSRMNSIHFQTRSPASFLFNIVMKVDLTYDRCRLSSPSSYKIVVNFNSMHITWIDHFINLHFLG